MNLLSDAEWERLENEHWDEAEQIIQERLNRVRVFGYALACARRVEESNVDVERALSLLQNAQSVLDKARAKLASELEAAEIMSRVIARGDGREYERIASALEEAGF
jgi:hypothetical protein